MNKPCRIKNPAVTLYAFHARQDLEAEISEDAERLWKRIAALSEPFSAPELAHLTEKLLCYEKGEYCPQNEDGKPSDRLDLIQPGCYLRFQGIADRLPLNGMLYPVRLHDTYAADFMLSCDVQETDAREFARLNPGGVLVPANIQASLGQTLLLYAEPSDPQCAEQELADECVNAFLQGCPDMCPRPVSSGRLFGNPLFEYETDTETHSEYCHVLVWLNVNPKTAELTGRAYHDLLRLLWFRSKIIFAYAESRRGNPKARKLYSRLESQVKPFDKLRSDPYQREELLTEISQDALKFSRYIRDMKDFQTMITTNAANYENCLKNIEALSEPEHEDDLGFWEEFRQRTVRRFQKQIRADLSYLLPGQNLFEQIINTVRGLVEIDTLKQLKESEEKDSERQKKLQILITFIATVLAGGTISATINAGFDKAFSEAVWLIVFHLSFIGLPMGLIGIILLGLIQGWLQD